MSSISDTSKLKTTQLLKDFISEHPLEYQEMLEDSNRKVREYLKDHPLISSGKVKCVIDGVEVEVGRFYNGISNRIPYK